MPRELHLDYETRSQCDLKARGLDAYANDPTTDILVACFAFDDEPIRTWCPGYHIPDDVRDHIVNDGKVIAHNAAFEIAITNRVARPKYDWPLISPSQVECTMAMAFAMSLPGALEKIAPAIGLSEEKDMEGHRLMLRLSKSLTPPTPEELIRLTAYCRQDVEVERLLAKRLLRLSPAEQKVWILDQEINRRGIAIDMGSVNLALEVVKEEKERLDAEMQAVTKGAVASCTAVSQLKDWLQFRLEKEFESLDKAAVLELLATVSLPGDAKKALLLRQEAGKSSVSKLDSMKNRVVGGRIRGTLQYHGAGTGRWAGRGIQPQNFPKGKYSKEQVEDIFSLFTAPDPTAYLNLFYGRPLTVISDVLRSFIVANEGKILFWGDYNAIEARVLAWLSGEQSVLDVFTSGEDLYVHAYARSFGLDPSDVDKSGRQIGKVQTLALGYQGGMGAFQAMARGFGISISDKDAELSKDRWRAANPNIVKFWWKLDEQAQNAAKFPGDVFKAGKISFKKSGSFLFCRLPSGRVITYPYPKIQQNTFTHKGKEITRNGLTYMGKDSKSGKWERQKAYGGMLAENVTQGVARDLMVYSMFRLEEFGYPVVFTVHDEIIVECDQGGLSCEEGVENVMSQLPEWATGLPMKVDVKSGKRYQK